MSLHSSANLVRAPFIEEHLLGGRLVGAVTVAVRRSGTVHVGCAGVRDLASGEPVAPDTLFRLHSMSKPLTAVGLLSLCEAGLCELEMPARHFVPELSELTFSDAAGCSSRASLTLRQLLTHTSGFSYPNPKGTLSERSLAEAVGDMMSEPQRLPLAQWTKKVGRTLLAHAPGAGFTYGVSIDVLGGIIEVIAGKTLDEVLRERVFSPLGMDDTTFCPSPAQRRRLARIYRVRPDAGSRTEPTGAFEEVTDTVEPPTFLSGGGGIFSTPRDYARFCQMLLAGGALDDRRILSAATLEEVERCQLRELRTLPALRRHRDLGPGASFGLLGRVVREPDESHYGSVGTFGWDGVCGNTFFVDRSADLAGILLTQILPWPARLHQDFRAWIYGAYGAHAPATLD